MNPRFLPDEPPAGATVKITPELSREELGALDRACAENKLTREQFARRAFRAHLRKRAGDPG